MDIATAILEISRDGTMKTQIMYKAFLSFPQLTGYLELLIDAGLVRYFGGEKVYRTTENGRRFLKMYQELDSMIPHENMLTKRTPISRSHFSSSSSMKLC